MLFFSNLEVDLFVNKYDNLLELSICKEKENRPATGDYFKKKDNTHSLTISEREINIHQNLFFGNSVTNGI